jgi:hypothetical protein
MAILSELYSSKYLKCASKQLLEHSLQQRLNFESLNAQLRSGRLKG